MINCLINSDLEYIRCFSEEVQEEYCYRFWDYKLEEMYANNITVLKGKVSNDEIIRIIKSEIEQRIRTNKEFLVVELSGRVSKEVLRAIKIRPTIVNRLDYMIIDTKNYYNISSNKECDVKRVVSEDEYKDLIDLSILDNGPFMGEKFSRDRINRKTLVFKEEKYGVWPYICYANNIAVGTCEMFIKDKIAKIEDFGILEEYQRSGYGTTMIKYMLMEANKNGVDSAYIVTESNDTAKYMYSKCGFSKIGEKTQILYIFK